MLLPPPTVQVVGRKGVHLVIIWCAHIGSVRVDRRICPEPCSAVHLRCVRCGAAVGGCPFEGDEPHERLVRAVRAAVPCSEIEALGIVTTLERAGRLAEPITLRRARSIWDEVNMSEDQS
jgi:hypothetical protein